MLNAKQLELLRLLAQAGPSGALVYGRAYHTSARALEQRKLVSSSLTPVKVVQMGVVDTRWVYSITSHGLDTLVALTQTEA